MVKIHVCLNIFNEIQFIDRVIKAVADFDRIVIIDGAYEGYPTKSYASADGTIQVVRRLRKKYRNIMLVEAESFWPIIRNGETESKYRTFLPMVPNSQYFMRLAGDEVFDGDVRELKRHIKATGELPFYQIPFYHVLPDGETKNTPWWTPNVIKKTPTVKVTSRHLVFTNEFPVEYHLEGHYGRVEPQEANIECCRMLHFNYLRDEKRKQSDALWLGEWYRRQKELEDLETENLRLHIE